MKVWREVCLGALAGVCLWGLVEAPATMVMCLLLASPVLAGPPADDTD